MSRYNRQIFYSKFREAFDPLSQSQVDGLNFLLDKLEKDTFSLEQSSYVLATVKHETANTFQPIKEFRARKGTKLRATQDRYWLSGFFGRGYVMITWEENYKKFGIADSPAKALEPETAYDILSRGMRNGMFTKFKLSDFVNGEVDYVNARKVVNGLDKAVHIADIAEKFEKILKASLVTDSVTEASESEPAEEPRPDVITQEPAPPAAVQAPKPEVTPVAAPATSITTKIAAGASALGPAIAATGLKIGGVEFKTGGLIAIAVIVVVGMIVSAYLYNESQKRAFERQKLSMENLASETKGNVIAAGSKV